MNRVVLLFLLFVFTLLSPAIASSVDDAALAALGKSLSTAIQRGDAATFGSFWNPDAFTAEVTDGVDMSAEFRKGFLEGIHPAGVGEQFGKSVLKALGNNGSFAYLGLRHVDVETRPVLRCAGDQGLAYYEIIARRNAQGKLLVDDVYIYLVGQTLSQIERGILLQAVLNGTKKAMPPAFELLKKMQAAQKAQDWNGVIALYDAAPANAQHQKTVQLLRITALYQAGKLDDYRRALEEYAKLFNGDATADLLSLDSLYLAKDYPALSAALDRLDKQVGHDPYLNVYRSNIATQKGDSAGAKRLASEALAADPTFFNADDILLTAAIQEKDYATVKKHLLLIEQNHPAFRFGDLTNSELFSGFITSPEYKAWQIERPKSAGIPR